MPIANHIANFGARQGQNIERRIGNAMAYKGQQNAMAKQEDAQAKAAQMDFMKQGISAIASMPQEQRSQAWEGLRQGAAANFGQDHPLAVNMPQYSDEIMSQSMARFGVPVHESKGRTPSGIQEFNHLATAGEFSPDQIKRAALRKAGLIGTPTQAITIANNADLAARVASTQADIKGAEAGAKESAKLKEQLNMLPRVRGAIKQAEAEASERGEVLTDLARAQAALPGLQEVSKKLASLADIATYTLAGQGFDMMTKQLGFGSTEGATARAKITSIVDNQVLPLLRDTFGAAFTAAEGDRLRDTLLDPNATPEAKKATLEAFIEQKIRNVETKQRELGQAPGGANLSEDGQALQWAKSNPNDPRAAAIMGLQGAE